MKSKGAQARGSDVYHKAFKKVSYWNGKEMITPENPNAYKFELFAQNFFRNVPIGQFGVIEVAREDDFAPVKNADFPKEKGIENDSPMSARNMLLCETTRWLLAAGFTLSEEAKNNVEISYLLSYRGENLDRIKEKVGGKFEKPGYVDENL
jgi:UDP-N-acetylglucosamine/UDP-N-acetylgalactosamine diphosphorylase